MKVSTALPTLFIVVAFAATPFAPCYGQDPNRGLAQKNLAAGKAFMAENRKKEGVIELPNGLQYRVINAGSGPKPKATDTVSVHYRGTLIDGSEFESSARTGKPASFRLDSVLKGWQEALPNMSQGSKWQIVIPPELGYGEQGAGGRIGPNETMVFDIELVGIGTGGAQTAAAREAERKAREREAGSGPTSQPSVDWKNTQYTLDCDMSIPIKVDVRNGHAERPPDNDYSQNGYIVDVKAVTRPQDLTGGGKPETAVLLYCSPQPSNFWTQEVQVFTDGSKLLAKLRSVDPLPTGLGLSPVFDPNEFTDGYKLIRIGLTIQEVSKVTGLKFSGAPPDKGSDCTYVTTPSLPGLWLILISGTIARIDVDKGDYATPEGAKLGDTEEKIKRLYPKAEVDGHKYFPEGHYFTIRSSNKERAIVFETKDGKKVSTFRVGRPPEVEYVEGCG